MTMFESGLPIVSSARARSLIAILAVAMAGCSNQPIATSQAEPVPKNRMMSMAYAAPTGSSGTVIVKRDTGLMGGGCNWVAAVNGTDIASMAPGEIIVTHPPAGEVFVSVRPTAALCPGGLLEATTKLEPGKTKAFRMGMEGLAGTFRLQPTAP